MGSCKAPDDDAWQRHVRIPATPQMPGNRGFDHGTPGWIRTNDPHLRRVLLFQLSYRSIPISDGADAQALQRTSKGSGIPASAKPLARSKQAGHVPHGGTLPL